MKKILFFVLGLFLFVGVVSAADFNADQLALRQNIVNFLTEEGFAPSIDSDGDIRFKVEGETYYVVISEANTSPLYLYLYHGVNYGESYTKSRIQSLVNEIQLYKGIKLMIGEKSYSFRIEMFLVNAEHFKYTFYKHLAIMKDADKEVDQKIAEMTK